MSKSTYDASSIRREKGAEAHRHNPARYIGAADVIGIKNQLFEIVDNAVDEMIRYSRAHEMQEYAKVKIEIKDDDTVVVEDFGEGIPCEVHPIYGEPTIYILTEEDSSGGKGRGTAGYDSSDPAGINGAGMAVAKSLATVFELEVNSGSADGKYFLRYIEGQRSREGLQRVGDLDIDENGKKITGTKITYHYDPSIFDYQYKLGRKVDEVYSDKEIQERLKGIILGTQNDNIEIIYKYKDNPEIIFSNKTVQIQDYVNPEKTLYMRLYEEPEVFKGDMFIEYNPEQRYSKTTVIVNRMIMKSSTAEGPILDELWDEIRFRINKDPRKNTKLMGMRMDRTTFLDKLNIIFIMTLPTARYSAQTKDNLTDTKYLNSMRVQMRRILPKDEVFTNNFYEPYMERLIEDRQWEIKRKKDEERRREREQQAKAKSKSEEEIQMLKNDPLQYELNKDKSNITIKESPKPIEQSTLVYVEGKSAGSDFNDLHKEKEYPIAIAIAEGKMPNVANPEMIDNEMTRDNILYCLHAGYKDIAIFTDPDADGNHIRLLHLMQIYMFAKHYLDEGRVYIVPAPYSTVNVFEYTSINLYNEIKNYAPGTNYLYTAKEHQALVNAGAQPIKKFRGLADSSLSLKELLINNENWIKVAPLTPLDVDLMKRLLTSRDDFKSDFMVNVYTERLYFSNTILNIRDDISVERNTVIEALRNDMVSTSPEDSDYKSLLSQAGIYDEEVAKAKLEKEFDDTHYLEDL